MNLESELSPKSQRIFSSDSFTRHDIFALAAVIALFAGMLAQSWQKWLNPIIDHGREINQPARLLAGEVLYRDTQFLYGPFAPYFGAFLYRVFGVHLSVLHAAGIVCALLITLMIYWLSRRLLGAWESAVATGFVIVVCGIRPGGNYVQPYTFAALYGLIFALASLIFTAQYLRVGRAGRLAWAGMWAGLSMTAKLELALAALAAALVAITLESFSARKPLWREAVSFITPAAMIVTVAFGLILWRVEWRALVGNHIFMVNPPPQLAYFNRYLSGLVWPGASLLFSLSGLGVAAWWMGASAMPPALAALLLRLESPDMLKRAAVVLIAGSAWWALLQARWKFQGGATPFSAAAILLPLAALFVGWRVWRARSTITHAAYQERLLLVILVFGFVSILRVILNVPTSGTYTPFFLPVVIVVYLALFFRYAPGFFTSLENLQAGVRRTAMALVGVALVHTAYGSIEINRTRYTFPIETPRGRFVVDPRIGRPFLAAMRFVEERTAPDDYVACVPQLTAINFFTGRRHPLSQEIISPGLLNDDREAIERIRTKRVPLILVVNLDTPDFRERFFGLDYNRELMGWIERNYHLAAGFDLEGARGIELGKEGAFILAYERNQ